LYDASVNYLFGDSTESPFATNVLEFLRDALDFAVFVLQADDQVTLDHARAAATKRQNDADLAHLAKFFGQIVGSIDGADKGMADSPTARCAAQLKAAILNSQGAWDGAVRGDLEAAIGHIQAEEAALRAECRRALATLLFTHDPPGAAISKRVLLQSRTYQAMLLGDSTFGLGWTIELLVPESWSGPVRVEPFMPALEIRAPQTSGWLMKEVTLRPQKLERHFLTELVCDRDSTTFKLRAEPDVEAGFDVTSAAAGVSAARIGPKDDPAVGGFELEPEDVQALRSLAQKLDEWVSGLARQTLLSAFFDGTDFVTLPKFAPMVQRLVATLTPIVGEIARRSPTPNELVIRRLLADNRREEVFVSKATLRAKYAELPEAERGLFAPLGLEPPKAPVPPPAVRERKPSVPRAEVAPSVRPPKFTSRPPPAPIVASPAPVSEPKLAPPPAPPGVPTVGPRPAEDMKNAELAKTLRLIFNTARSGRTEYAYSKLAELFSSAAFAGYEPNEQREALKLMVHASDPPKKEFVLAANRAALGHLKKLAESLAEPADWEMLGLANLRLDDTGAANAAFEKALELERARNAESELTKSLTKRLGRG
jgi:hypothetical protein